MKKNLKKTMIFLIIGISFSCVDSLSTLNNIQEINTNKRAIKYKKNNLNNYQSSTSYIDNYVPQETTEIEFEKNNLFEEKRDVLNIYSTPTNEYKDNEHIDDKPSGATNINYQNGTIIGSLNKNDGWTQFWNGVGERDEDYFRFTLPEKLKFNFSYSGPSNYNMRILYISQAFICTSQSKIEIELDPGTYYLHIYTNETENIVDQKYIITYSSFRISNKTNFLLTDSTKSKNKMALWENEVFPKNAVRYTKKEQTLKYRMKPRRGTPVNTGYVDPLFYSNEKNEVLTDCIYLDSILYIWDKNTLKDLYDNINCLYTNINEAIKEKNAKDLQIQIEESISSITLTILGFIPGIGKAINIFSTVLSVRSDIANIIKYYFSNIDNQELTEFQIGYALGTLNGILYEALNLGDNDIVVKIPKFYYFKKTGGNVGNNTLKAYSWKFISTNFQGAFDKSETYLHIDASIDCTQSFNGNSYHGNIITFDDNHNYFDYINGNNEGISLGNHNVHEFNNIKDYDSNNHILFCDCGYQKLEEHKNYYDLELKKYTCEYCNHEFSINSNSINKEKYGYNDEYNVNPIDEYIIGNDGKAILTKRLRCAFINNYLIMSAKSNDANQAYLEYDFDYQIIEFNYNIALWSNDESLVKNSSITLEYYNDGWKVKRTFNPKEMSVDKDNLIEYFDVFETGATKIRFIIRTNYVNNTKNRGRMVIGNIDYKYGL